jgi:dephospho-CoA kinase
MKLIGLTGGIASGKSTVTNMLRDAGFTVLCADEVSREICKKGQAGATAIREAFGVDFFYEDGTLNRKKLGAYVFADKNELARLNALLHPLIMQAIFKKTEGPADVYIIDAALLIETGLYKNMDEIWLITADEETRRARLMARDALAQKDAELRFAAQMPEEEKRKFATRIIDNSGDIEDTKKQVQKLIQPYIEGANDYFE